MAGTAPARGGNQRDSEDEYDEEDLELFRDPEDTFLDEPAETSPWGDATCERSEQQRDGGSEQEIRDIPLEELSDELESSGDEGEGDAPAPSTDGKWNEGFSERNSKAKQAGEAALAELREATMGLHAPQDGEQEAGERPEKVPRHVSGTNSEARRRMALLDAQEAPIEAPSGVNTEAVQRALEANSKLKKALNELRETAHNLLDLCAQEQSNLGLGPSKAYGRRTGVKREHFFLPPRGFERHELPLNNIQELWETLPYKDALRLVDKQRGKRTACDDDTLRDVVVCEMRKAKILSSQDFSLLQKPDELPSATTFSHQEELSVDWDTVRAHVRNSSRKQRLCKADFRLRWERLFGMEGKAWLAAEIEALKSSVARYGERGQWKAIALDVSAASNRIRRPFECLAKWQSEFAPPPAAGDREEEQEGEEAETSHGNAKRKTVLWTAKEDELLRRAVEHFGKDFNAVCQQPGLREKFTKDQCLFRYRNIVGAERQTKAGWDEQKDEVLRQAVQRHQRSDGSVPWSRVSLEVPGKTDLQCRERWTSTLDPSIKKGKFSREEEIAIVRAVRRRIPSLAKWRVKNPPGIKFPEIARANEVPGRTGRQLKDAFNRIISEGRVDSILRRAPPPPEEDSSQQQQTARVWSDQATQRLIEAVKRHGRNWERVSSEVGEGFRPTQCKGKMSALARSGRVARSLAFPNEAAADGEKEDNDGGGNHGGAGDEGDRLLRSAAQGGGASRGGGSRRRRRDS